VRRQLLGLFNLLRVLKHTLHSLRIDSVLLIWELSVFIDKKDTSIPRVPRAVFDLKSVALLEGEMDNWWISTSAMKSALKARFEP
jgi:hypothetical protein